MRSAALRREYLTALGRAAPFAKQIDASLAVTSSTPTGFALDTAGAFAFLQTDAAACAAADIGVILPSWWLGMNAKARVGSRAVVKRPKFAGANALHAGALLEIDWTIALGDAALTARELERLARLKTPLVQIRGHWVHVDQTELQAALARVKRSGQRTMSVRDAVRLAIGAPVARRIVIGGGLHQEEGARPAAGAPPSRRVSVEGHVGRAELLDGGINGTVNSVKDVSPPESPSGDRFRYNERIVA